MDYIKEALNKLNEEDFVVVDVPANEIIVPTTTEIATSKDDINSKLISKIEAIAEKLADAFKKEHINLDPELIKQDMIRDCGLMGGIVSTDELDINNPFDAATKEMHDIGPVNTQQACAELLRVTPEEFVNRFMMGMRMANRSGNLLPPGHEPMNRLRHNEAPRQLK